MSQPAVLIVELDVCHGQVTLPYVQKFLVSGWAVHLAMNLDNWHYQDFADIESPHFRLIPVRPARPIFQLRYLLSLRIQRFKAILFPSPFAEAWIVWLTLMLLHRRCLVLVHRLSLFPSPTYQSQGGTRNRLVSLLMAALSFRLVFLSPGLAEVARASLARMLRTKVTHLVPLPRLDVKPNQPGTGSEVRFFLPGSLNPQNRNYALLMEVLAHSELPSRARFLAVGRSDEEHPEIPAALRHHPQVELQVDGWTSEQQFLALAAGCHFLLPLDDRSSEFYGLGVSSAYFISLGLQIPLMGSQEMNYLWPYMQLKYETADEFLECIREAIRQVDAGLWPALRAEVGAFRTMEEGAADQLLRSL